MTTIKEKEMSAPKPELTPELRAIAERLVHDVFPSMDSQCAVRYVQQAEVLVSEIVEIVARKSADVVKKMYELHQDHIRTVGETPATHYGRDVLRDAFKAVESHWGLK